MGRGRKVISPEFKQEAVELLRRGGKSANQLAKELGIDQTTLSRWRREAHAAPPGQNPFELAEEVKRLRREVERLQMERDILTKATAFFAKDSS